MENERLFNDLLETCVNNLEELESTLDYFNDRLEQEKERKDLEMEVNRLYDEYLQKTENRNMSYGEYVYTSGLSIDELNDFYDELTRENKEEED